MQFLDFVPIVERRMPDVRLVGWSSDGFCGLFVPHSLFQSRASQAYEILLYKMRRCIIVSIYSSRNVSKEILKHGKSKAARNSTVAAVALRRLGVDSDGIGVIGVPTTRTESSITHTATLVEDTHNSTSASCCKAFLAMVWKACSTLMASFADVSKYGMLPLD